MAEHIGRNKNSAVPVPYLLAWIAVRACRFYSTFILILRFSVKEGAYHAKVSGRGDDNNRIKRCSDML
jgi:hypothetical protein